MYDLVQFFVTLGAGIFAFVLGIMYLLGKGIDRTKILRKHPDWTEEKIRSHFRRWGVALLVFGPILFILSFINFVYL